MPSTLENLADILSEEINELDKVGPEEAKQLGKIFLAIHNKCGRAWIENCLDQIDTMAVDRIRPVQSIDVEIERGSPNRSS